jgi:hypothetical protein
MMSRTLRSAVLTVALGAALAACSGTAATPGSSAVPGASGTTQPSSAAAGSATAGRVSANAASAQALIDALTAAGVPNPDRWAKEIQEYRPYDAADATLQKLQDNLAKYNPDPATLAAILSTLQP